MNFGEWFNKKDIESIVFEEANEEWFNFVINNRMQLGYTHKYDIVKGPVADDRVCRLNALKWFMDKSFAIKELRTYTLADQISFHTKKL